MDYSTISYTRTIVQSEEIISSVNEILTKHYLNIKNELDLNLPFNALALDDMPKKMQLDKVFITEMEGRLWDKALFTAVADITTRTFPDISVVESLVNYTLNVYLTTDVGLVKDFFSKLVMFHPPSTPEMKEYYYNIMSNKYVTLNNKKAEEESLFFCLLNNLMIFSEDKDCLKDIDSIELTSVKQNNAEEILAGAKKHTTMKNHKKAKEKSTIYFDELPPAEKVKRCLICLNFLYDIFEADFVKWFENKSLNLVPFDKNNAPLLARLIWEDVRDIGISNSKIKKILTLQQRLQDCNSTEIFVVDKLLVLLAEIIRYSDALTDPVYPFFGSNSQHLARELSFLVLERLKAKRNNCDSKIWELTIGLKPTWLRLLVISHLLSTITGHPCAPELTSAVDILTYIEHENFHKVYVESPIKKKHVIADPKLTERFKKLKSVNLKLVTGGTRLHSACRRNNIDEVKALLTFPELEINATDNDNWTALHEAAYRGNKECVQELLSFWPQLGEVQKPVDTRAQGRDGLTPLMCAVLGNHPEICQLLLEHTGSVLLEDVNEDNKTALDLSTSNEVTEILQYYKKNIIMTEHSRKKMHFSAENTDVVMEFCYQLVQSYFSTCRTWDVYHALKAKTEPSHSSSYCIKNNTIQYCYTRYFRDIKTNIEKLRKITAKIKNVTELKNLIEPLICILSLNKYQ